ncbi:MAG: hypothetical protein SGPRY_010213, partial [Prymnesium sp.]
MYQVSRHTGLKTRMPWQWYLERAAKTCLKFGISSVGFMDGTVAREVLKALTEEGTENRTFASYAATLSANMRENNGKYLASFGTGASDRGQMHYRAGLNMIPLIEWYRAHPDDLLLLEISMGAITGQMANIDADGATSMMWHALPHVMDFDPHSGDYGLGFFGNALESGSYY